MRTGRRIDSGLGGPGPGTGGQENGEAGAVNTAKPQISSSDFVMGSWSLPSPTAT